MTEEWNGDRETYLEDVEAESSKAREVLALARPGNECECGFCHAAPGTPCMPLCPVLDAQERIESTTRLLQVLRDQV